VAVFVDLAHQANSAAQALWEASSNLIRPGLRLGVTGLARSGKTVFTTAMVHHLMKGTRLHAFRAASEGRLRGAHLLPQPDDDVPRFAYEAHLAALTQQRIWPQSTQQISELRLVLEFESQKSWRRGARSLTLDVVDYPGEWLLDLALLQQSYEDWCREVIEASWLKDRVALATPWHEALAQCDANAPYDEEKAAYLHSLFKAYLLVLRAGPERIATTPPGRFLMPGDLNNAPALTFAPLVLNNPMIQSGTMAALMRNRFEAYKKHVVLPFFRSHFQRLDRQIVLVDVLSALDSGPLALAELERALDQALNAFRVGKNTVLSRLLAPRIDKVLFAATKADHVHHSQHDRLEAILRLLVARAVARTQSSGAEIGVVALASVRATRETLLQEGGETLQALIGTPEQGEEVAGQMFDGTQDAVIFPGDLPDADLPGVDLPDVDLPDADETVLHRRTSSSVVRFPRFRPPVTPLEVSGQAQPMAHIRLDRALEFLFKDYVS
jgi:uncharacterized protein